eukprot:m.690000 g.690000  ORF g.690000 m.690000 type:complete len:374 (-) comp22848_c0_seq3:3057-4178(-)
MLSSVGVLPLRSRTFALARVSHAVNGVRDHASDSDRAACRHRVHLHRKLSSDITVAATCSSAPVAAVQELLGTITYTTGMPWWMTITAVTLTLRATLTTPLYILQQQSIAKYQLLQPQIKEWVSALKYKAQVLAHRNNTPLDQATKKLNKDIKAMHTDLLKENGLWPWFVRVQMPLFIQIPLWVSLSFALRGLTSDQEAPIRLLGEFVQGGVLWFPNLAIPDVWYGLPLLTGLVNLANLELSMLARGGTKHGGSAASTAVSDGQTQRHSSNNDTAVAPRAPTSVREHLVVGFFRLLSVGMVWIGAQVPSALTLYWATSSVFGLAQNLVFRYPAVRQRFNIPSTPTDSATPIRHMAIEAKLAWRAFVDDVKKNN